MLRLVIDCENQVRYFALARGTELSLGSAEDNDICVPFAGVSRRHAQLRLQADGVLVSDVGSKNGIVGPEGSRHRELLLSPGRSVRIGRAVIGVEEVSTSDVELALAMDAGPQMWDERSNRDETEEGVSERELGSPREALRLVRELDRMEPKALLSRSGQLLDQVRSVVSARSLLLATVGPHSKLAVVAHSGAGLSDDLFELLEGSLGGGVASGGRTVATPAASATHLVWRGSAKRVLIAAFSGDGVAAWRTDFLDYVSSRLCGASMEAEGDSRADRVADPVLAFPEGMVVGSSAAMTGLLKHLRITVNSDLDVLLVGETGTGKELFAQMIHQSGPTCDGPFVPVNCAAIPNELLEAELFGVLAGAATGVDARPGLFLKANGGTIFLDEITEMADRLHAKLLRVLQEREVLPVGGSTARRIKVRVISASNRDLGTLVREGGFRPDLYYRLRGLQFHIPPLRERREDIPDLVMAFVARAATKYRKRIAGLSRKALRILIDHDWPGNVRELETEVERAVLLCPPGAPLESDHFASVEWELRHREVASGTTRGAAQASAPISTPSASTNDLQAKLDAVEREAIQAALTKSGGNKTKAAAVLGVTRNGLRLKMIRLGVLWQ